MFIYPERISHPFSAWTDADGFQLEVASSAFEATPTERLPGSDDSTTWYDLHPELAVGPCTGEHEIETLMVGSFQGYFHEMVMVVTMRMKTTMTVCALLLLLLTVLLVRSCSYC